MPIFYTPYFSLDTVYSYCYFYIYRHVSFTFPDLDRNLWEEVTLMKVSITGQFVVFVDDSGTELHFSTRQLLEILKLLNISLCEEGIFIFDTLEFTV